MRRLGDGAGFTKIDLADARNQIRLAPKAASVWPSGHTEVYCFKT